MSGTRILAVAALCVLAALLLLVSVSTPLFLPEQAEENRRLLSAFRTTAAYVDSLEASHGRRPTNGELRGWAQEQDFGWVSGALHFDEGNCAQEGLEARPNDHFVLAIWRGEWFECYASPSGHRTFATSVREFLLGWLGAQLLVEFLLGCLCAWAAWRLVEAKPA